MRREEDYVGRRVMRIEVQGKRKAEEEVVEQCESRS